jgi:hypothetical protein
MITFVKKVCGYFAASLGLLFSVKEGFSIQAGWSTMSVLTLGIGAMRLMHAT